MSKKKADWGEIIIGGAIIAGTLFDVLPGDEVVGIPLGIVLILKGLHYIK